MDRYYDNCNNLHIDVPKEFIDKINQSLKLMKFVFQMRNFIFPIIIISLNLGI